MSSVQELAHLYDRTDEQIQICLDHLSWTQSRSQEEILRVLDEVLRNTRRRDLVLSQYSMMSYVLRPRKGANPMEYVKTIEGEFRGKWNAFLKGGAGWLIFPNFVPKLEEWLDNPPEAVRGFQKEPYRAPSSDCRAVYHALLASARSGRQPGGAGGSADMYDFSLPRPRTVQGDELLRLLRSPKFGPKCLPHLQRMAARIDPNHSYPSIWAYYLFDDSLGTVYTNDARGYAFKNGSTVFVIPKAVEGSYKDQLEPDLHPNPEGIPPAAVQGKYQDGDLTYVLISTTAPPPDRS